MSENLCHAPRAQPPKEPRPLTQEEQLQADKEYRREVISAQMKAIFKSLFEHLRVRDARFASYSLDDFIEDYYTVFDDADLIATAWEEMKGE